MIGPRDRLLAASLRLLEEEGPQALQARRLAAEIDASTMAVYTHFGGMPRLLEAVVLEGLGRFAAHVRSRAAETEDPVADLMAGGMAYGEFAFPNPQLYRLMFGLTDSPRLPLFAFDVTEPGRPGTPPEGSEAFSVLLGSVERVLAAGRFRPQEATVAAAQVLSATHGFVLLSIGGLLGDPESVNDVIAQMSVNLMVGLGDSREAAERSFAAAQAALAEAP